MNIEQAGAIGENFMQQLDKFIQENLHDLTCDHIREIYFQFWKTLKQFRGNSDGFTGLSELVIFRFLFHLLGGSFKSENPSPDKRYRFNSTLSPIWIGQSFPVSTDGKKYRPDITIGRADELVAVVQIKITLPGGINTVESEWQGLSALKQHHPDMMASLIIFSVRETDTGKIKSRLDELARDQQWFNYIPLRCNQNLFGEALREQLGLDRILLATSH